MMYKAQFILGAVLNTIVMIQFAIYPAKKKKKGGVVGPGAKTTKIE